MNGATAFAVWDGKLLTQADGAPRRIEPAALRADDRTLIFADGTAATIVLRGDEEHARAALGDAGRDAAFNGTMFDLGRYGPDVRERVLRSLALERWATRERFCMDCGRPLRPGEGASLVCSADPPHRQFPRIDPAVIVLVRHEDRALLGRAARWPPGWYSTLAGFVEPGEDLEATVRREVYEEAGVRVGATRYISSEPWPFPRSLMLGFFADALDTTIERRDGELEDARWFSAAQVAELVRRMRAERPFFDTIAHRLMTAFAAEFGLVL